jgi:BirA family biotin operon repressor/biotin-[acetyl-CoA-carboxylase] ligase
MSRSKKCCGILIENTVKGTLLDTAIIGIGINVNEKQFKDLPLASSLRLTTGNSFDISLILEVLLQQLKIQLTRLENQDLEAIFNSYNQDLFRLDTVAVFSTNTKVPFNAILRGVTKSGLLVLEDETSQRDTYNLKEIKYHF